MKCHNVQKNLLNFGLQIKSLKYDKFYMIFCHKQPHFSVISTVQFSVLKFTIMADVLAAF